MAEPVRVVKKDDNSGIGKKAQDATRKIGEFTDDWWGRAYDAVAKLNALNGSDGSDDSDDSDDSSDSDDPIAAAAEARAAADPSKPVTSRERDLALFRACGGRQLGMRARGSQNGKLTRT